MKTFGNITTKELITLQIDENGSPIFDRPLGADDSWQPPVVVPLVKLSQPTISETQKAEPKIVWFDDRVERQWQIIDLEGEELAAAIRKTWPNSQAFLSEFTMQEMAAIALSTDTTIAALRLLLSVWFSEVHSNDSRVIAGLDALVSNNILTTERVNQILSK